MTNTRNSRNLWSLSSQLGTHMTVPSGAHTSTHLCEMEGGCLLSSWGRGTGQRATAVSRGVSQLPKAGPGLSLLGQPQALFLLVSSSLVCICSTFLFTVVILDKMLHLSEDWAAVRVNRRKTLSLKRNLQEPGSLWILTKWFQWCGKFAKHRFVNVTAHLEAC